MSSDARFLFFVHRVQFTNTVVILATIDAFKKADVYLLISYLVRRLKLLLEVFFSFSLLDKIYSLFLCFFVSLGTKGVVPFQCLYYSHIIFLCSFLYICKLGDLPLIQELNKVDEGIRTTSTWVK